KGGFTWDSIGNEMQDAQFNVFEEESGYSIMLVPFFRITPRMNFTVQGISYAGDKDVTFNIPVNIEEKEMPHKIGEVEGISFYVEGFEKADEKTKGTVGLKLVWESDNDKTLPG